MRPTFDGEGSRTGEGDIAAFERDCGLARGEHDLGLGEDVDGVAAAGHRHAVVGEDLQRVVVGL